MSHRITALFAAAAALFLIAPIATAAPKAPRKQKLAIVGTAKFKINRLAFDSQHFSKDTVLVRSGGTVTLRNKARTHDPHTISLVTKSQLPHSFDCEVCGAIFAAHGVDEATGSMANPVVDVGAPGYDQPGDSTFVAPHATVRFKVTAPAGTTLRFLCAIHPWMQGRIKVR